MKPLTINVDDIKDAGQPWETDLPRDALDAMLLGDLPTEFHAGGAAHVRARLTKLGRKVLVQSSFTVPLSGLCKRCLTEVSVSEPVDFTLTFVPAPESAHGHGAHSATAHTAQAKKGKKEDAEKRHARKEQLDEEGPAGSFTPETADEEIYTGKQVDLEPALREAVLLAIPPSPLCKEDCRGLCSTCGKSRNEVDCGHQEKKLDRRWEALKSVQLQPKQETKKE